MDTCPNCHRKLLSHASVRCNWCGAEIGDESYQQQAAQERANYRAHEAERDAIEAARAANSSFSSVIWGSPLGVPSSIANNWAGRKRWQQAKLQAQQKAMEEFAATQQGGINPQQGGVSPEQAGVNPQQGAVNPTQQPPQNNQIWQGHTPIPWQGQAPAQPPQQAANQADQEEPATPENEVRSMFRHLEL